jgi:hypothetical protein
MHMLLVVLAAATQTLYVANVASFACNSPADVSELRQTRGSPEAFQYLLLQKFVYGDCLEVGAGTVVNGFVAPNEQTMLQIQSIQDPPGYVVPTEDFTLRESEAARP